MQNIQLMHAIPCTASQQRALEAFRKECFIMLSCAAGPWFVLPPCPLTQFLCALSGASVLVFTVSPQRATSFGACLMLCIFSVSMIKSPFIFLYGKSSSHLRKKLPVDVIIVSHRVDQIYFMQIMIIMQNMQIIHTLGLRFPYQRCLLRPLQEIDDDTADTMK